MPKQLAEKVHGPNNDLRQEAEKLRLERKYARQDGKQQKRCAKENAERDAQSALRRHNRKCVMPACSTKGMR